MSKVALDTLCCKKVPTLSSHYSGSIEYIDISSVDNEEKEIVSSQVFDAKDAPSRAKQLIEQGDVLVSTVRPNLNAVAFVDKASEHLLVASTGYCVLRCHKEIDRRYIFHFCQSPYFIDDMTLQATGASYPAVSSTIVKCSLIPDVSDAEKQRIVTVLDKVNELISLRKQQLAKLDELVKARFVELFGTGHDGRCATAMLGSVCKFQQGTQIPVDIQIEEKREGYKRFLRIIDYTQAPQAPRYVDVDGKEIDEKSVVIVRYGATAGFAGRGYSGILANNLFEIVPDEAIISRDFLYLALKHGTFERDIHEKAFGAAMPALSFSMMNDIAIVVPSHEEQEQFAAFVEQTDKSKLTIQQSLDKLEILKKALMQKYFE